MDGDLVAALLREIRDEVRSTNLRLDQTNTRLDRVVQEQIRLSTAFVEMQSIQRETAQILGLVVKEISGLNARLDNVLIGPMGQQVRDHEDRIARLERKVSES